MKISFPAPRTLRDILARIKVDTNLTDRRKADLSSAIRRFAEATGRTIDLSASFQSLRPALIQSKAPAGHDQQAWKKTWANIRSNVQFALRRYGCVARAQTGDLEVAVAWDHLRQPNVSERHDRGLSRFINWAIGMGIMPDTVSNEILDKFKTFLIEDTLLGKPLHVHRRTAVMWNQLADSCSGWPQIRLGVPDYKNTFGVS